MNTAATVPSGKTLGSNPTCDYCHQRPKFGAYSYCGKTCAAQAATLCNHCRQKPKFGNFEYCGKNCATQAGSKFIANPLGPANTNTSASIGATLPTQPAARGVPTGVTTNSKGNGLPAVKKQIKGAASLAPALVSHIQQAIQAQLHPQLPSTQVPTSQGALVALSSLVQPASGNMPQQPANPPTATTQAYTTSSTHVTPLSIPQLEELDCLIPGCGQPVHVDANGTRTSEFCSMRHREEAVTLGIVSPCIMCLKLPQSETDHFCSRTCREEALSKSQDE